MKEAGVTVAMTTRAALLALPGTASLELVPSTLWRWRETFSWAGGVNPTLGDLAARLAQAGAGMPVRQVSPRRSSFGHPLASALLQGPAPLRSSTGGSACMGDAGSPETTAL
jgi:hypothetical protein